MLKVNNLTKKFNSITAVNNVSFKIDPGEIFTLIGPNGSGKTTIIKVIAGLLRPTGGNITIDGHDITQKPIKAKAATGYIPDEPTIWSAMTGEEFLRLSGALYSVDKPTQDRRIERMLSWFNLKDTERGYFDDYSRGNKQKFAIIAAMLHKPKLLLIDEPIVGLDPVSADIAQTKFSEFAKAGGSVLLVTHTLSVAQKIANRFGVLKNGKLIATGTYEELKTRAGLTGEADLEDIYRALT